MAASQLMLVHNQCLCVQGQLCTSAMPKGPVGHSYCKSTPTFLQMQFVQSDIEQVTTHLGPYLSHSRIDSLECCFICSKIDTLLRLAGDLGLCQYFNTYGDDSGCAMYHSDCTDEAILPTDSIGSFKCLGYGGQSGTDSVLALILCTPYLA